MRRLRAGTGRFKHKLASTASSEMTMLLTRAVRAGLLTQRRPDLSSV